MNILIVDDSSDDRKHLRYSIEHHGHEAIEAEDGQDGLGKAVTQKPDLIISDVLMPKMDGFQLLRAIKRDEKFKDVPFVFYSAAYNGSEDTEVAASLGASLFIVKPKEAEEFWRLLRPIIDGTGKKPESTQSKLPAEEEEFLRGYSQFVVARLEEKVRQLKIEIEAHIRLEEKLKARIEELEAKG